jgi:hypothetical protein
MTQSTLVLPGLLWPGIPARHPAAGLALPAFAWLLGRGRRRLRPFAPLNEQLAHLFGLEGENLPFAALRRRGEAAGGEENTAEQQDANACWLCVDPVYLSFAHRQLLLGEFDPGEIGDDETRALIASLNANFGGTLGRFSACSPTRWYLRLHRPAAVRFFALHEVSGQPIQNFLPEGNESRYWRRALNEIQIALHAHPVNREREATGQRPINSVWPWGVGALAAPSRSPHPLVMANDPLTRGLALAAQARIAPPKASAVLPGDALVVLDTLLQPARALEVDTWQMALQALETEWFAPIRNAFVARRLSHLKLVAPGEQATLVLDVERRARWRFWRQALTLDKLPAAALPSER